MLPAGCGHRVAAALAAALRKGEGRRRELERERALLQPWAAEEEEKPQPGPGPSHGDENRPLPKELVELELLNRALEKALKVRKSISKTLLEVQGATEEKPAGEEPAPKEAEEQQVPVENVPEDTKVRAVSKRPPNSKKPTPYQLKAPYRTDPDVRKLQRKASARCVSQGPRTARTCSSKAVACKQGRSRGAAVSAGDREGCAPAELQKTPSLSRSALNEHQSVLGGDSVERRNSAATGRSLSDSGEKSCGFLEESSTKENPTAEGVLGRSTLPRTGTLQEKGQQLKLPLPYRKAYSRNSRAWERCRRCPTSAEVAAARNRFMERIQTTLLFEFWSPVTAFSPAEIEEELRVLQDVPSLLSQYMEAEPKDYPTLQREYESLLTLEGLQTTVSQCLDKLQLLRAAVESQKRLCPDCAGDVRSCSSGCAPARGQTGDSAGVLAVPLLCYSRLQELRDLFALKLRVSMLHQQVALQKVVMAELLPVLESRLCPEEESRLCPEEESRLCPEEESRLCPEASTALLYRAAYTQLCAGGERFPVLVRDELTD